MVEEEKSSECAEDKSWVVQHYVIHRVQLQLNRAAGFDEHQGHQQQQIFHSFDCIHVCSSYRYLLCGHGLCGWVVEQGFWSNVISLPDVFTFARNLHWFDASDQSELWIRSLRLGMLWYLCMCSITVHRTIIYTVDWAGIRAGRATESAEEEHEDPSGIVGGGEAVTSALDRQNVVAGRQTERMLIWFTEQFTVIYRNACSAVHSGWGRIGQCALGVKKRKGNG